MMTQRKLSIFTAAVLASISCWPLLLAQAASPSPFMDLTVKVTLEEPPCVLNDNKPIEVNFDDVFIEKINQGIYQRPIEYTLNCEGKTKTLSLTIVGAPGFDSEYLDTSKTGLAIDIQKDNQTLPVNSTVNFTLPDAPKLNAVLVKQEGTVLDIGHFTATARMIVDYQ
ncbi:fimbrial protein [Cedecea davisae]|uniref:Fimbrial protein n=1 Tax=Cedecea davisae TaxID=158484 RepID=A0ABS6DLI3_9ENTR|nr:fimbrial protein [Cedecea davisae]MBU4684086.1 fimbrial protein [Cedecea davisae]MBU4689068.1 fimbrial protein [Cedecea davisae]